MSEMHRYEIEFIWHGVRNFETVEAEGRIQAGTTLRSDYLVRYRENITILHIREIE